MTGRREEASMFPPPPVLSRLLHLNGIPLKDVPHFELLGAFLSMEQHRTHKWSAMHGPRVEIASPTADRPLNRRPHLRPKVKLPDRVCEANLSAKRCMSH